MFIAPNDPATAPTGGAEPGQVIGLGLAATLVTDVLLVIASPTFTREFVPEIGILQLERNGAPRRGCGALPTSWS